MSEEEVAKIDEAIETLTASESESTQPTNAEYRAKAMEVIGTKLESMRAAKENPEEPVEATVAEPIKPLKPVEKIYGLTEQETNLLGDKGKEIWAKLAKSNKEIADRFGALGAKEAQIKAKEAELATLASRSQPEKAKPDVVPLVDNIKRDIEQTETGEFDESVYGEDAKKLNQLLSKVKEQDKILQTYKERETSERSIELKNNFDSFFDKADGYEEIFGKTENLNEDSPEMIRRIEVLELAHAVMTSYEKRTGQKLSLEISLRKAMSGYVADNELKPKQKQDLKKIASVKPSNRTSVIKSAQNKEEAMRIIARKRAELGLD